MKISIIFSFVLCLAGATAAQQIGRQDRAPALLPGAVYGEILIKEVSGNNVGNFPCANLTVYVSKLEGGWQRSAKAIGNFSARRCSFRIPNVPAGEAFVAVLKAQFPNACDEQKFETTTSFPMKLKGREQLKYDFSVSRIRCVLVK